jgi:hypothetical protein
MSVNNLKGKEIDAAVGELYNKYLTPAVAKNYIAFSLARDLERENARKMESNNKKKKFN